MPSAIVNGQRVELTLDQMRELEEQYARMQSQQQSIDAAKQTYTQVNPLAKFAIGVGAAAAEPVLGAAQGINRGLARLGADNQAKQDELDEMLATVRGARQGSGGWGTAGEIAGWLGSGAAKAPALLAKAPQVITKAPALARAAGLGAVEQAAYEGSRGTLEGDPSRLQRAGQGAAGGAAGGALGDLIPRAISRVVEPVKASAMAQNLVQRARDLGVQLNLSAGQAAGRGSSAGGIEEAVSAWPVVGAPLRRMREGAVDDWNRAMLTAVVRTADPIKRSNYVMRDTGAEAIELAQRAVKDAYTQALEGRTLRFTRADNFDASLNAITRLPPDDASIAQKLLDNIADDIKSGNVTGDAITTLRTTVNDAASKAYRDGNYTLGRAVDAIDNDLRKLIGQTGNWQKNMRLQQADNAYAKLADINRAAAMKGAVEEGGRFTPSQLVTAMKRGEPDSMVASARTPGLRQAVEANDVLGNALPKPGPGTAEKLLTAGALGGAAAGAEKLATGDELSWGPAAGAVATYALLGTPAGRRYLTPSLYGETFRPALANELQRHAGRGVLRQGATRTVTEMLKDKDDE